MGITARNAHLIAVTALLSVIAEFVIVFRIFTLLKIFAALQKGAQ